MLPDLNLKELNAEGGDNYITMKTINRKTLIAEEMIRQHVRSRISNKINEQRQNESVIRNFVRKLIVEAETGTEEPSQYTGINVLADLLEKIIPILEDDYKMLTTSEEQRESFRNHIIHAIKNSLNPIETVDVAEKMPENTVFDLDLDLLVEKVKIDLSPEDEDAADSVAGEFIDIAAPENEDQFVTLDDQNETGRNFAATTFKQIEKQIVDSYDMLADSEDKKMFYDYLITNVLLYFDKFEDELQPQLPDTTTPEYEENKDQDEDEAAESEINNTEEEDTEPATGGDDPFAGI